MRICTYGTYDLQQPRTRVILEGLRRAGADVVLCHADLWKDTSQKVHLARHPAALLRQLAVARGVYQTLARQRRSLGACDVVVYPHMGQFDLLTPEELAPFFILLAVAGNDTTRTATTLGMHLLSQFPDQRRIWQDDIEGVSTTAVEEIVRCGYWKANS